jgi:hypothetical protein
MRYALVLLLLTGCAHERPTGNFGEVREKIETITLEWNNGGPTVHSVKQIAWVKLPEKQLQEICKDKKDPPFLTFNGCYRFYKGIHLVITGEPISPEHVSLHCTLGHEVRHAFDGAFHGNESVKFPCNRAYGEQR